MIRVLPRAVRAAAPIGASVALWNDLFPDGADPITLQQLRRTGSSFRIALEASLEEFYALLTQLLSTGQLRRVALGDIVHDGPFIVEARPRTAASAHLEDHAAEGPYVYRTETAFVGAFDDLRGHVHWSAGHGLLLCGNFRKTDPACGGEWCFIGGLECFVLAGNDFGGAEVDVFDDAIVVKQNVYENGWLATGQKDLTNMTLTFGLNIPMGDAGLVEICQPF